MIKKNSDYFKYSLQNPDPCSCVVSGAGVKVISDDKRFPNPLQRANRELEQLITAYEVMRKRGICGKKEQAKIIRAIIDIVEQVELINYSAFCVYFQVLDRSYSSYISNKNKMSDSEKIQYFREILDRYIQHRHTTYLMYGYSDQVLQVMSDSSSSRRKGRAGITKIEDVILPKGFTKATTLDELKGDMVYIWPDKGGKKLFEKFIYDQKINFTFSRQRDNKYPDCLLKINNEIFIVEHKLTNGGGGSQNAEVNEIIAFIGQHESNTHVHYVSCLQGDFMCSLANPSQPKNKAQYENICTCLQNNPQNYFVNGLGFEELLRDLLGK